MSWSRVRKFALLAYKTSHSNQRDALSGNTGHLHVARKNTNSSRSRTAHRENIAKLSPADQRLHQPPSRPLHPNNSSPDILLKQWRLLYESPIPANNRNSSKTKITLPHMHQHLQKPPSRPPHPNDFNPGILLKRWGLLYEVPIPHEGRPTGF